ncbi:MAG: AAA family ATPase [Bacilli bacterium]|nr:AAA family ATPase [Bacilli bacterium]
MYLKRIIANGFKSFADKINIELTDGITSIVGPNGSGKSNVVDAVRWVLGEQSVKSLRGDGNTTDVIFSGSKSRKPSNYASVTLIFDNKDKYLNIPFDEIEITRRVYRDSTNEYFLNNERVRLKDITNLLLDSGIAKESFNIISQGKVEEIISSKPESRRVIFEEAASVLKYRKRKEEALRKLERTHDNMNRVNDIINELKNQVEPLKEQRDKAIIYLEKSGELESVEVALITKDITDINDKYVEFKSRIESLNKEIIEISVTNNKSEAKIEEYKLNLSKLEEQINKLNNELLEKTTLVEKLNSEKTILLERKKYDVEDTKLHNNILELKEKELEFTNNINQIQSELDIKLEELNKIEENLKQQEKIIEEEKTKKINLEFNLSTKIREKNKVEDYINSIKDRIENNGVLPSAVKSILNNIKIKGICDTIGNLIEVEEQYSLAITTSLGATTSYVVVENELCAKESIKYLKDNNLGRVTFFPLNIIKPKYIDDKTIESITKLKGFVGIAKDLVKCEKKYQNIIENQLGNVIVVDNIDNANIISKEVNYRYKIVTLTGELLHVGGSITGGTLKQNNNVISLKYELENNIKKLNKIIEEIKNIENDINDNDYNYKIIEDKLYLINRDKINLVEYIKTRQITLNDYKIKIENIKNEINGTNGLLNNSLSSEENNILKEYYEAINSKNKCELELENLKKQKITLNNDLEEYELNLKQENSIYNQKNKELKELEIDVNRMDVKLDNLLNKLNETYSMTYEKAVTIYKLEIPEEEARNKVNSLRKIIKDLGNVNVDSIEEYDKVSERYEFLCNQKEDLMKAEDTLLLIIKEMDEVMTEEFTKTFKTIRENFIETFKELFKGGTADLKLTDPSNILETGIEIVASPPGKSLKSISLLSGGEKTFTAISLLFAILKSRPVPFCILDEVEAALDEVNVDSFGNYLKKLQEKTQFILITHKKRTMEYADILYGITMQESGVSKLVSVKLEDVK